VTHGRVPRQTALRAAPLLVALLAPFLLAAELDDLPAPVAITVGGRSVMVAHDATFGQAIHTLGLRPVPGRLLDVEGDVLDPRADPGSILLNGRQAPRRMRLSDDDVISVVDGVDRTEPTERVVQVLPGHQPGNPMFTLATSRVEEITTLGEISRKVTAVRFQAIGPTHRPPTVALTFDDGPWPGSTRRVLEVLHRMHVPATFFMIGYLMQRYPGIVRSVERAGMTIGTHSWSHPYLTPFTGLTPHRIQTEVERPAATLRARFGIDPALFRPPGGAFDPYVVHVAQAAGMRVVRWSVDPSDYLDSATPASIASQVLGVVGPGSIVLLHDGGGDQSATIRALPRIIRGIRRMGLELVALPT
jgi:peptidoglycan-N-acetylglucosamine deacetylase